MDKRIITAAITGSVHTPSMSPYLPITPDQIVDETVRAYEAGATVAHIHARDPKTGWPASDMDCFREVLTVAKSKCKQGFYCENSITDYKASELRKIN